MVLDLTTSGPVPVIVPGLLGMAFHGGPGSGGLGSAVYGTSQGLGYYGSGASTGMCLWRGTYTYLRYGVPGAAYGGWARVNPDMHTLLTASTASLASYSRICI